MRNQLSIEAFADWRELQIDVLADALDGLFSGRINTADTIKSAMKDTRRILHSLLDKPV